VIDNLFLEPEAQVAAAVAATWGPPQGTYYPGLNAPLSDAYLPQILSALRPSFGRAFGFGSDTQLVADGFFALATWGLEQFGPWQRIPHYDQPYPGHLAMVHYLNAAQGGGTGFFRHSTSGFESIDMTRREAYLAYATQWLDNHASELTGFAGPDTPGYEMHDLVGFRFNRAVIYPSNLLHCALFDSAHLSADPRIGRLTANSFFRPV
jgi:hypothetical protein